MGCERESHSHRYKTRDHKKAIPGFFYCTSLSIDIDIIINLLCKKNKRQGVKRVRKSLFSYIVKQNDFICNLVFIQYQASDLKFIGCNTKLESNLSELV